MVIITAEKLNTEHLDKIQKVLDSPGKKEVVVKEEKGKIVILKVKREIV